jgi:hypothetical protein
MLYLSSFVLYTHEFHHSIIIQAHYRIDDFLLERVVAESILSLTILDCRLSARVEAPSSLVIVSMYSATFSAIGAL